ncbi:two-component response regulator [Bradyrhizobium diazoefficiens]|uniref:Regulatory protein VirG n=2 Tax=Bradyrhizobium diazoefficiens TaxID=1355477 RepID=A0A837CIT5_9BRAD|nr:putative two-component response regulator [Bradyrhizobium diazoefficiens SEMIA 5080]BAR60915.1 two-component response regulator [Bradyrhizobium diazoefficiens]
MARTRSSGTDRPPASTPSNIAIHAMSTQSILIVEDDQETRNLVARYLRENSFNVGMAANGREMDRYISQNRVDLIVLDLMLPGEDGLSLCRRLRVDTTTPIIILTAKGDDVDRILGLEMGADDYLPKPFNPRELLARINAVLRRQLGGSAGPAAKTSARLRFEGWIIDSRMRELRDPEGAQVPLTSAEFDLLQSFCERHGRILSRDTLLNMTRGRPGGAFGRSIDVLVSRLRGKLDRTEGTSMIKTVRTGGYIFTPRVDEA